MMAFNRFAMPLGDRRSLTLAATALTVLLSACSGSSPSPDVPDSGNSAGSSAPVTDPGAPPVADNANERVAGNYCYQLEEDTISGTARIQLEPDSSLTGHLAAVIQDNVNNYYTSYRQTLTGQLTGTQLQLAVVTDIENSVQDSVETWTWEGDRLETENEVYTQVDCAQLPPVADGSGEIDFEPITREFPVQFAPGTSSTVVENAVIRGERDVYVLAARANQIMTLSVSALEDNARMDVESPSGALLEQEASQSRITLPETGTYRISVGGTRGNASYSLAIEIR
ncbi:MAG: hypothetical protein KME20_23705 [Kaiparowitsia implicata GSE-PSE-MK54-09C]|jgi:hypothetical protein|nr:hypothetical protein [Kaiparowitsia implicata GSE-PSE-MK54-09C]